MYSFSNVSIPQRYDHPTPVKHPVLAGVVMGRRILPITNSSGTIPARGYIANCDTSPTPLIFNPLPPKNNIFTLNRGQRSLSCHYLNTRY
jgi:hypothetical protein